MPRCIDFPVDEGERAEPTRDKNITGMYRRRGSSPPPLYDPAWVVQLVVVEDGADDRNNKMEEKKRNLRQQNRHPRLLCRTVPSPLFVYLPMFLASSSRVLLLFLTKPNIYAMFG